MNNMLLRALTGSVFVAVLVAGSVYSKWSFFGLFLLIGLLSAHEFVTIYKTKYQPNMPTTVLTAVLPFVLCFFGKPALAIGAAGVGLFSIMLSELFAKKEEPLANIAISFMGVMYIGVPITLLCLMTDAAVEYNYQPLLGSLILVWTNDTGAYLSGRSLGKHQLTPVSPKKTWEGAIGGMILTIGVAYYLSTQFETLSLIQWLGMGVIVGVFGILGDLVESLMKRNLGIKDSGKIIPGHGGMLDRFDAFIFCVPFIYLFLQLSA